VGFHQGGGTLIVSGRTGWEGQGAVAWSLCRFSHGFQSAGPCGFDIGTSPDSASPKTRPLKRYPRRAPEYGHRHPLRNAGTNKVANAGTTEIMKDQPRVKYGSVPTLLHLAELGADTRANLPISLT
jgi:hypothetical protein